EPGPEERTVVVLDPTGRVVAAGEGAAIRLYDARTGKPAVRFEQHAALIDATWLGGVVALQGSDGKFHFWDPAAGKLRRAFTVPEGRESILTLSPDGKGVARSHKGHLGCLDAERVKPRWEVETGSEENSILAYSPDGRWLATAAVGTEVRVWDPATGR